MDADQGGQLTMRRRVVVHDSARVVFEVGSDAVPDSDLDALAEGIRAMLEAGSVFAEGQTILHGWLFGRFDSDPEGGLRLTGPTLDSMPMAYGSTVDSLLEGARRHRDVAASLDLPYDSPRFDEYALISQALFDVNSFPLRIQREASDAEDPMFSGLTVLAPATEHFSKISLYELGMRRPDLVMWFALPAGLTVIAKSRTNFQVSRSGVQVGLIEGSFLDGLRQSGEARKPSSRPWWKFW